jgi:hypothetical protein
MSATSANTPFANPMASRARGGLLANLYNQSRFTGICHHPRILLTLQSIELVYHERAFAADMHGHTPTSFHRL